MDVLRRLVRLYAPFICTITAYIHGYKFLNGSLTDSFVYNCSINAGFSVIMVLYVMATAKRMCIWYKLNLGCLLGICACSFIYKYVPISEVVYFYAVTLLSGIGIIFFLLTLITYSLFKSV